MNSPMKSTLYADHFRVLRERFDRALEHHQINQLLVYSGTPKTKFLDDQTDTFSVNPWFKALVPLVDASDSWVIWRLNENPLLLLYQPEDFWHAVPEFPDAEWTAYFEINILRKAEDAQGYFGDTRHSAFLGEMSPLIDSQTPGRYKPVLTAGPDINQWDLGQHNPHGLLTELNWYRSYKTSYEQDCIQQANQISARGHRAARDAFFNGASEFEIALAFQGACGQGENELAYPSIVGINEQAAILHKREQHKQQIPKESLRSMLIDAGAQYQGYASDITRTYACQDGLFAELVAAMDNLQQGIVREVAVGKCFADLTESALLGIAGLLKDSGVLKLEPETALETGVIHTFMPHRLGHFLGLQVHDVGGDMYDVTGAQLKPDPRFPRPPLTRVFESDQVITVEPGVYFITILLKQLAASEYRKSVCWDKIQQLQPYGGIRIEDDIVIKADSTDNLTRTAFAALPAQSTRRYNET